MRKEGKVIITRDNGDYTVNRESFAGVNFRGFDPMKYLAEILSQFIIHWSEM